MSPENIKSSTQVLIVELGWCQTHDDRVKVLNGFFWEVLPGIIGQQIIRAELMSSNVVHSCT